MTEKEWLIEMLCCLPKESLYNRINGKQSTPEWLSQISIEDVREALNLYDVEEYVTKRNYQKNYY